MLTREIKLQVGKHVDIDIAIFVVLTGWDLGFEVRYGNPESASFPLRGTGKMEGGENTQPFNHFLPRLVTG